MRGLPTFSGPCASVCLALPAPAQDAATWKDDVRGWFIGVDQSVGNGCFMSASFDGDTFLRIGFNVEAETLQFIIGDSDWRSIEPGKLYPMEVRFGSRSPWTGDALGFDWGDGLMSLVLDIPFDGDRAATFIRELQQLQNVNVRYKGQSIANLSLRGTHAAMTEVITCQSAMMEAAGSGHGPDPFGSGAKPGADPFR